MEKTALGSICVHCGEKVTCEASWGAGNTWYHNGSGAFFCTTYDMNTINRRASPMLHDIQKVAEPPFN